MKEALPPIDDELDAMLTPGRVVPSILPARQAALLSATLDEVGTGGPDGTGGEENAQRGGAGPGGRLSFGVGGLVIGILVGGGAMWAWNETSGDVERAEHREEPSVDSASDRAADVEREVSTMARATSATEDHAHPPRRETPAIIARTRAARFQSPSEEIHPLLETETPRSDDPSTADFLAEERRIIDAALAQVSRGHAAAALRAVARHERLFPAGQLAEAREVVRIRALAQLGRMDDARASLAALVEMFPGNRVASSLRTLLSQPAPSRELGPR